MGETGKFDWVITCQGFDSRELAICRLQAEYPTLGARIASGVGIQGYPLQVHS